MNSTVGKLVLVEICWSKRNTERIHLRNRLQCWQIEINPYSLIKNSIKISDIKKITNTKEKCFENKLTGLADSTPSWLKTYSFPYATIPEYQIPSFSSEIVKSLIKIMGYLIWKPIMHLKNTLTSPKGIHSYLCIWWGFCCPLISIFASSHMCSDICPFCLSWNCPSLFHFVTKVTIDNWKAAWCSN